MPDIARSCKRSWTLGVQPCEPVGAREHRRTDTRGLAGKGRSANPIAKSRPCNTPPGCLLLAHLIATEVGGAPSAPCSLGPAVLGAVQMHKIAHHERRPKPEPEASRVPWPFPLLFGSRRPLLRVAEHACRRLPSTCIFRARTVRAGERRRCLAASAIA